MLNIIKVNNYFLVIIGHFENLTQCVEQGAFAGVGTSDNGYTNSLAYRIGYEFTLLKI